MEENKRKNNSKNFYFKTLKEEEILTLRDFQGDRNKRILLSEIYRYTPYSQEYLSLRARQGKLKAVKLGRDWMTTVNWMRDYLDGVDNNKNIDSKTRSDKKIVFPSFNKVFLGYGVLALIVFCLVSYSAFYWRNWAPQVKNNFLSLSSAAERNFTDISKIFKSDYRDKTEKIGMMIVGSLKPMKKFPKVLSEESDLAKNKIITFKKNIFSFSQKLTKGIKEEIKKSIVKVKEENLKARCAVLRAVNFNYRKIKQIMVSSQRTIRQVGNFADNSRLAVRDNFFKAAARLFFSLDKSSEILILAGKNANQFLGNGTANLIFAGERGTKNLFSALDNGAEVLIFTVEKGKQSLDKGLAILVSISRSGTKSLFFALDRGSESLISFGGNIRCSVNDKGYMIQGSVKKGWSISNSFLSRAWNKFSDKLSDGYLTLLNYLIPERTLYGYPSLIAKSENGGAAENGMVIFPLMGQEGISRNKYLLAKIEKAFSDEVILKPSEQKGVGIVEPTEPAVPGEK
ncbi:MAG: hypothetical protein Athens101410_442 [Parcubacteria group bacterium Athens1014_10]|nr:MAG: hypothetical protein Athens101410_442 [Parcubacteria group bacterium Athens1014_10]